MGRLPRGQRRAGTARITATRRRPPPPRGRSRPADERALLRTLPCRADDRHPRLRGAAPAPAPAVVHRQGRVVPALQRTRRGFRPRVVVDARGAGRRRVGRQRSEGVEHAGAPRRPRDARDAHGSRRSEAPGAHLFRGRHARTGRRGPSAAPDHRRSRVQRGVPHRRPHSPTPIASAKSATVGGCR